LAGFEPTNLGSNGKYDNHYTTEDDIYVGLLRTNSNTGTKLVYILQFVT
jgi:hypothetical protein